ncbi:hypothetical protein MUN76_15350 [Leucobacter rhizosphaerae]|uniref:DUF3168 domain-containing protein n=1 Tax=Leucobacter rhizosphaerae TaxID=2932245 RepID=A0ABY4FW38_9MICO|nr:hypothetical protein [Leucobacter rhizosphaerae]UOQ60384.1 hypothetical protein MUN76_15350 [Leucobacter rhizosphaerae]
MTIRKVRDAVLLSLGADLPGSVFKSYSASSGDSYAVVWITKSRMDRSRYSAMQNRDVFTVTIHSVGADEDSCLWVQERVDRLTNRTLAVSGRRVWPVEYVTGRPPDLDDDGPNPLWFSVSQFDIISDPA